jgi:SH3/ankyrin repeat-containing protein
MYVVTPISTAVMMDDKISIKMLLDNGAFYDYRNSDSKTPLHVAAIFNKLSALQTLMDCAHAWVDCIEIQNQSTPLICASQYGSYDCLMRLLGDRANVHVKDTTGKSPLHHACTGNHAMCVSALISYGAQVNERSTSGNTALHICAASNSIASASELLKRGAVKDATNKAGQTAQQVSVFGNYYELAEVIKKFPASSVGTQEQTFLGCDL